MNLPQVRSPAPVCAAPAVRTGSVPGAVTGQRGTPLSLRTPGRNAQCSQKTHLSKSLHSQQPGIHSEGISRSAPCCSFTLRYFPLSTQGLPWQNASGFSSVVLTESPGGSNRCCAARRNLAPRGPSERGAGD